MMYYYINEKVHREFQPRSIGISIRKELYDLLTRAVKRPKIVKFLMSKKSPTESQYYEFEDELIHATIDCIDTNTWLKQVNDHSQIKFENFNDILYTYVIPHSRRYISIEEYLHNEAINIKLNELCDHHYFNIKTGQRLYDYINLFNRIPITILYLLRQFKNSIATNLKWLINKYTKDSIDYSVKFILCECINIDNTTVSTVNSLLTKDFISFVDNCPRLDDGLDNIYSQVKYSNPNISPSTDRQLNNYDYSKFYSLPNIPYAFSHMYLPSDVLESSNKYNIQVQLSTTEVLKFIQLIIKKNIDDSIFDKWSIEEYISKLTSGEGSMKVYQSINDVNVANIDLGEIVKIIEDNEYLIFSKNTVPIVYFNGYITEGHGVSKRSEVFGFIENMMHDEVLDDFIKSYSILSHRNDKNKFSQAVLDELTKICGDNAEKLFKDVRFTSARIGLHKPTNIIILYTVSNDGAIRQVVRELKSKYNLPIFRALGGLSYKDKRYVLESK